MKLSIILPCHNGAETIACQLQALAEQTYRGDWELIVSNNGSTDESMAVVEAFRDRLPLLRIVQAHIPPEPLRGVTRSYNAAMAVAAGDAFAFCEDDDRVSPQWLSAIAQALECHHLIAGPLDHTRLNADWLIEAFGRGDQQTGLPHFYFCSDMPFASGCNLAFRREVYETLGPLDESIRYTWDADFCWQAQRAGFPLVFVPDMIVYYRLPVSLRKIYGRVRRWCLDNRLLEQRYGYQASPLFLGRLSLWIAKYFCQLLWGVPRYLLGGSKASLARSLHELGGCVGRFQANVLPSIFLPS